MESILEYIDNFVTLNENEISNLSKDERSLYNEKLKIYRDIKNVVDTVLEEAEKKGEIKGRKQQAIKIATNFLLDGLSMEIIAKNTELSLEEIQNIKNSLNL